MSVSEWSTDARIRTLQRQLRIAIQNHQALLAKKRVCPNDPDIRNHVKITQDLIISMGRSQSELMAQFRSEIASRDKDATEEQIKATMKKHLLWKDTPKEVPVLSKMKDLEERKAWKKRLAKPSIVKPSGNPSLKMTNGALIGKDKCPLDASKINKSLGKHLGDSHAANLIPIVKLRNIKDGNYVQLVLKDKTYRERAIRECQPPTVAVSEPTSPVSDLSESRSGSPLSEPEDLMSRGQKKKKPLYPYGKRYDMRSQTKKRALAIDRKDIFDSIPIPGFSFDEKEIEKIPRTIHDLKQDSYLGYFGLISRPTFDAIKRKRCERKRRSVAGQSSLYSDYLQAVPKRTYGPRKPVVPIVGQSIASQAIPVEDDPAAAAVIEKEIAEVEKPNNHNNNNNNNNKREEVCLVCSESSGELELCPVCNDAYHTECLPADSNGASSCPNCSAQSADIGAVVGANSAQPASSSELIKRYLSDNNDSSDEKKSNESGGSQN